MDVDGIFLIVRFFFSKLMGIYISLCASCCHPCQRGRPWTNPTNPPVSDSSEIFFTFFLNIKSFIIVGFLYGFLVLFSWSLVFKRKSKFRCVWTVAVHISEPGHARIVFCWIVHLPNLLEAGIVILKPKIHSIFWTRNKVMSHEELNWVIVYNRLHSLL